MAVAGSRVGRAARTPGSSHDRVPPGGVMASEQFTQPTSVVARQTAARRPPLARFPGSHAFSSIAARPLLPAVAASFFCPSRAGRTKPKRMSWASTASVRRWRHRWAKARPALVAAGEGLFRQGSREHRRRGGRDRGPGRAGRSTRRRSSRPSWPRHPECTLSPLVEYLERSAEL